MSVDKTSSRGGLWAVRCTALVALAVTIWLAGPRAYEVLSKRIDDSAQKGPKVDLSRGRLVRLPAWLEDESEIYLRVLLDLEPLLRGAVGIMDEAAAQALHAKFLASPWVKRARIERVFPDSFHVSFELRQPVLQLVSGGVLRGLVDAHGVVLPAPSSCSLPSFVLRIGIPSEFEGSLAAGDTVSDPRIWLAIAVAEEWAHEVAPKVEGAPRLVEVDASNLGLKLVADPFLSEVTVGLETADGEVATMQFGRPRGEGRGQGGDFEPSVKIDILGDILAEFPGLRGLVRGDLRLKYSWRDNLVER